MKPHHPIENYLYQMRKTKTKFAQEVGISLNYLVLICQGKRYPSRKVAKDIERVTDKLIKIEQIMGWEPDED